MGFYNVYTEKIPWDDSYKVGIKIVDDQHKQLFDIVNKLYDLEDEDNSKEELRSILYKFNEYMQTHFKDEEEYMASIGYPALDEHKQIHNDIMKNLADIVHTPAKLAIIKSKMRVVAKRVLIDHIVNEDIKIKLFQVNQADETIFDISDL